MARTARCVAALPGNIVAGGQVRALVDKFLETRPELVSVRCDSVGSDEPGAGPSDVALDLLRHVLASHLADVRHRAGFKWRLHVANPGWSAVSVGLEGRRAWCVSGVLVI